MRRAAAAIALLAGCARQPDAKPHSRDGYAAVQSCAACHAAHAKTYRLTGMGRSFYRATPQTMTVENFAAQGRFEHTPSGRTYQFLKRENRYFLRRHEIGPDGGETNILSREIHYVMGSGNHARTYLHRTPENRLYELPVAWYPERGGYFAMNPGYDQPKHLDSRRQVAFSCMFCHNGYPQLGEQGDGVTTEAIYSGELPEGIDCQRCHGPGQAHVDAASKQAAKETVRKVILNPSRLTPDRQMELCMQCHLETTSFALPNAIPRYERGFFSYRPDEPLGNYMLFFDHAPGTGHDDKLEIVNASYRLRQSACFLKSAGKLTCTTCHNPHDVPRGEAAAARYTAECRKCHPAVATVAKHPAGADCLGCHMPRRRTEDVVHVIVTDHKIQRHKPKGDLLAMRPERHEILGETSYQGEVALYYPQNLAEADRELYTATAQVVQKSNLEAGIRRLEAALSKYAPTQPVLYFQLAQAYVARKEPAKAVTTYERALKLDPRFLPAMISMGGVLIELGEGQRAVTVLEGARKLAPRDGTLLHELARAYRQTGRRDDALAAARLAVEVDPVFPEAHNTLGNLLAEKGDPDAVKALREAIRHQPDYAEAHSNLGNLAAGSGDAKRAAYHYGQAVRHNPKLSSARFNYGSFLARTGNYGPAMEHITEAVRLEPRMSEAWEVLGNLYAVRGAWAEAADKYRQALKVEPEFARGHLGLGTALGALGKLADARVHLNKAASALDPEVRAEAIDLLRTMPPQ